MCSPYARTSDGEVVLPHDDARGRSVLQPRVSQNVSGATGRAGPVAPGMTTWVVVGVVGERLEGTVVDRRWSARDDRRGVERIRRRPGSPRGDLATGGEVGDARGRRALTRQVVVALTLTVWVVPSDSVSVKLSVPRSRPCH